MTTMNNDDTSSLYRGPRKTVWENGRQIDVPDYTFDNAALNAASSSPYVYKKTLEDVITSSDKFQYDRLKTDEERYAFIRNMITGIDSNTYPLYDHDLSSLSKKRLKTIL
jgi:hypothetical protein